MNGAAARFAPLRRSWALALALAMAALLALPALDSPLLQDDVVHRAILEDRLPNVHWNASELYDFVGTPAHDAIAMREFGALPWFVAPDLKLRFFRPLSSLVLAAEARIFGERTALLRLHSLIWFLAIIVLVAALHRRVLPAATANVATVIYAIACGHALPVSYIAARHGLIASFAALLGVWCHLRWRQDGWRPGRAFAIIAVVVGLFAGEIAIGALALVCAWEWGRREPWASRVRAVAPLLVLAGVYMTGYAALDYGARGSAAYVSVADGTAAAFSIVRHFFLLGGELAVAIPSDLFGAAAVPIQAMGAMWGAAMLGVVAVVIVLVRPSAEPGERAALPWLAVAAAGAMLPGTFALVGGRVLTLALVPASAIAAVVIVRGWGVVRRRSAPAVTRGLLAIALAGITFGHLVTGPVVRTVIGMNLARLAQVQESVAERLPACPGTLVIIASADPTISTYVPALLMLRGRGPRELRVLSFAGADHRIDAVTDTGFELTVLQTVRVRGLWERLYRSAPLPAGTRVVAGRFTATVVEAQAGAPTRVRFDFGERLDAAGLCFYHWQNEGLDPLPPPRPGESLVLPYFPGPVGW